MLTCKRCGRNFRKMRTIISHLASKQLCPPSVKDVSVKRQLKALQKQHGGGGVGFGNVICLGEYGGVVTGNLSCYLLQVGVEDGKSIYICLDGGSLVDGLKVYNNNKATSEPAITLSQIKAYLISHAHLDHIVGLVIATPEIFANTFARVPKPYLIATTKVIDEFKSAFNDVLWPTILYDSCFEPLPVEPNTSEIEIPGISGITISTDCVTHGEICGSTVFTITDTQNDKTVVYFGDVTDKDHISTAVDTSAKAQLTSLWTNYSSMDIVAVFIECAFSNGKQALYGHLDPESLKSELRQLTKPAVVFVTHRKPKVDNNQQELNDIKRQLLGGPVGSADPPNQGRIEHTSHYAVFPKQGVAYDLNDLNSKTGQAQGSAPTTSGGKPSKKK